MLLGVRQIAVRDSCTVVVFGPLNLCFKVPDGMERRTDMYLKPPEKCLGDRGRLDLTGLLYRSDMTFLANQNLHGHLIKSSLKD